MSVQETLRTQLQAALAQAQQQEAEQVRAVDDAKRSYARARDETRKLRQMLRLLQEREDGLTKPQAREVVVALLQSLGPQPSKALAAQVKQTLIERNLPQKGLSLRLSELRAEFLAEDGQWRLPDRHETRSKSA